MSTDNSSSALETPRMAISVDNERERKGSPEEELGAAFPCQRSGFLLRIFLIDYRLNGYCQLPVRASGTRS